MNAANDSRVVGINGTIVRPIEVTMTVSNCMPYLGVREAWR